MSKKQHDLKQLKKNGVNVIQLIDSLSGTDGDIFKENIKNYQPKEDVINLLEQKAKGYTFIIFSAEWCKDCKANVAAFIKILQKKPKIDAVFFKGLKTAPLGGDVRWKIPPSPPEVLEFDLRKIPTFYILNSKGDLMGEMIENPIHKPTLEEELVYILDSIKK